MSNNIELTTKAGVKIAVNAVTGGGGGGGGVTAHSALTGLTTGDDHTQYQRSESVYTTASSFTITDETTVVSTGSTVVLPSAQAQAGRTILVGAGADVTVTRAGTDVFLDGVGSTTFLVRSGNGVGFTSVDAGGTWGWAIVTRQGSSYDLPVWAGQSVAAGEVLRMGASSPEWTNADPGAYDFLSGAGWTDDVPVVIPCKNTSAGTISKGQAVYVTGTVGSTSVVEVALADCDDAAKMPAIGLAESTMAVNATGYVVVTGVLSGIDTSTFSINGPLYVSTTAGVLTGTKPTGTSELIQNIGRATRINANTGEVLVLGPGRTNDVPNAIDAGKLTSGTVPSARLSTKAVGGLGAGSGVALTATAASILSSTITLPACAAGDVLVVEGSFTILNNSTASRTYTGVLKLGATSILTFTLGSQAVATRVHAFQAYIRVNTTTSQSASASLVHNTVAGTSGVAVSCSGVATETISSALALDLTLASSTGTTVQTGTLEHITVTRLAA